MFIWDGFVFFVTEIHKELVPGIAGQIDREGTGMTDIYPHTGMLPFRIQEQRTRSQDPGARTQEPGTRS